MVKAHVKKILMGEKVVSCLILYNDWVIVKADGKLSKLNVKKIIMGELVQEAYFCSSIFYCRYFYKSSYTAQSIKL